MPACKTVVVTARHDWRVEDTKARLVARFTTLRANFRDLIGTVDVTWSGHYARVTIRTLGQTVTALCDIQPKELRILVRLPWTLAGFAGPIETFLYSHGDVLEASPKPDRVRPVMMPLAYHHRLLWVYRRLAGAALQFEPERVLEAG